MMKVVEKEDEQQEENEQNSLEMNDDDFLSDAED